MSIRTIMRSKRFITAASIPVAVVASGALVWQSSYSAFSATTSNPTNNWTAGTVALTDNDANTALFTAANLKPGSTGARCIVVSSSGSLPSAVKLYGTGYSSTPTTPGKNLGDVISLKVEEGTGATNAACAGFVPDAAPAATIFNGTLSSFAGKADFASGAGTWTPVGVSTGSESKSYRVSYTLSSTADNGYQGASASIGFTWEAQNS
jgi:hypothetical protein